LLLACVADDLGVHPGSLHRDVRSIPRNGNANVRKALQNDLRHLRKIGPVIAIVDWDKIADLWRHAVPRPAACKQGITARFREEAAGDYHLIFLDRNVETLVALACEGLGHHGPPPKSHDARDAVLAKASWAPPSVRQHVRGRCPSFERIVTCVTRYLRPTSP
jgi:hypothetical protein